MYLHLVYTFPKIFCFHWSMCTEVTFLCLLYHALWSAERSTAVLTRLLNSHHKNIPLLLANQPPPPGPQSLTSWGQESRKNTFLQCKVLICAFFSWYCDRFTSSQQSEKQNSLLRLTGHQLVTRATGCCGYNFISRGHNLNTVRKHWFNATAHSYTVYDRNLTDATHVRLFKSVIETK